MKQSTHDLHSVHSSPNIFKVIKSRSIGRART